MQENKAARRGAETSSRALSQTLTEPGDETMKLTTPEGLATATGVAILAASTNANVLQTGGWFSSHAMLVAALSLGVFAGARVVGSGVAGKIGLVIIAALVAGEMFNLSATAERIVVERENGAAPLKDAMAKHDAAVDKLSTTERAAVGSARLSLALAAQTKAQAAYQLELRTGGRCRSICNGLKADADKADIEVSAAAAEAQKLHMDAVEAAKKDVEANPLPASSTPLADRLGWPAWVLDLVMAGLLSVGANGLAGTLIAFGAHSTCEENSQVAANDAGQTDFSVSSFDAAKIRSMVSGEFPEPTPPKPRKRKKPEQFPENVISFQKHPVVTALKANGGSVESNQELATLMSVSKGESSKRWQEIEDQLIVTRHGKQLRIALKA
jgi:transcriptional regulator